MPVTEDDLKQLKQLATTLVKTLDAMLAQQQTEQQQTAAGLYPEPRTLTRKA